MTDAIDSRAREMAADAKTIAQVATVKIESLEKISAERWEHSGERWDLVEKAISRIFKRQWAAVMAILGGMAVIIAKQFGLI